MAFLEEHQKPSMTEDAKNELVNREIRSLVKARGFEPGEYKFIPNPNTQRRDGSIINGSVVGRFNIDEKDTDFVVFEREAFTEKTWKKLCTIMGFKYHVPTDIDKFTIVPNMIEVSISLTTPIKEDD